MVGAGEQRSKWVEQRQNEIARSWLVRAGSWIHTLKKCGSCTLSLLSPTQEILIYWSGIGLQINF